MRGMTDKGRKGVDGRLNNKEGRNFFSLEKLFV